MYFRSISLTCIALIFLALSSFFIFTKEIEYTGGYNGMPYVAGGIILYYYYIITNIFKL